MSYSWTNCGNVVNVLDLKIWLNVSDTPFSPSVKILCFFIVYDVTGVAQWGEVRWS